MLFLREHDRIARALEQEYRAGTEVPAWPRDLSERELDERLFQTTRNIMIVLLLKLVVEEYIRHVTPHDLPLVPGMAEGKRWNRSNQIAVEFNLLYRWHSLIPEQVTTDGGPVEAKSFLRDNNAVLVEKGVGWLLTQCSRSRAARVGLGNTPDWLVERKHPDWPAVEERTVALMRHARLASYNDYRRRFSLPPVRSFAQLTSDRQLQQRLEDLYGDIDRLEWYVGIFAEDHAPEHFVGGLVTAMVGYDAFTQVLTNPLLAPNVYNERTFTRLGLRTIRETSSLQQIVECNVGQPEGVVASPTWRPSDAARGRATRPGVVPEQREGSTAARPRHGVS